MAVRPPYGPSLPRWLRERFGVRERTTVIAAGVLAVLLVGAAAARWAADPREQLVHRGEPAFNLLYRPEVLRPVEPGAGELTRLEGRHGRVRFVLTVRRLPPSELSFPSLPILGGRHADALERAQPGPFLLREESRARVNGFPGYQVIFRAGPRGARVLGRDLLVFPDEKDLTQGVLVSLRQHEPRALRDEETVDRIVHARRAQRSFAFGTGRP